jgi:V-type H+-transporting ATPase subunit E
MIAQEAKEKAEEITVKTEREYMAEKLTIENQLSQSIRAEAEKHRKDYYIQKKIEKSKFLSEARFSTMRRRDDRVNELKKLVLSRLAATSKEGNYSELIRFFIAQGLQTLLEQSITIQCRKEDLAIVQKELPAAIKIFQDNLQQSTGVKPTANITIDQNNFLAPGELPADKKEGLTCAGGVVLSARNGQILCRNTLDHRLNIAFDALKPSIRGVLFGVREKIVHEKVERKKGAVSAPK